jgi:thioredoxin reductase
METERHDVLVIGAGAAGRSAALVLGRARRSVVLIDAGQPSNQVSTGIGGLLGNDQRAPHEFYEATRAELDRYPTVGWRTGTVVELRRDGDEAGGGGNGNGRGWTARLDDGSTLRGAHVLLAMGMRYDVPAIAGIEPLWGASVFHCPFCHGWEHRDQPLLMLAGGPEPALRARLLRNWSADVTVIDPAGILPAADRADLATAGIPVIDGEIVRLHGDTATRELEAAELADGTVVPAQGLLVPAPHRQRSSLATDLGVDIDESGHVAVDAHGHTTVDGVWAVGDLVTPRSLVANMIALGALAATGIVHDLVAADRRPAIH